MKQILAQALQRAITMVAEGLFAIERLKPYRAWNLQLGYMGVAEGLFAIERLKHL